MQPPLRSRNRVGIHPAETIGRLRRISRIPPEIMGLRACVLEFNLPFATTRRSAQSVPSSDERKRFREVLTDELRPWCDRFGSEFIVDQIPPLAMSPWQDIAVRTGRRDSSEVVPADCWAGLLKADADAAASAILTDSGSHELLIGRLAQRRHWSETEARLLAQRIAWSQVDLLKRRANVWIVRRFGIGTTRLQRWPAAFACRWHQLRATADVRVGHAHAARTRIVFTDWPQWLSAWRFTARHSRIWFPSIRVTGR